MVTDDEVENYLNKFEKKLNRKPHEIHVKGNITPWFNNEVPFESRPKPEEPPPPPPVKILMKDGVMLDNPSSTQQATTYIPPKSCVSKHPRPPHPLPTPPSPPEPPPRVKRPYPKQAPIHRARMAAGICVQCIKPRGISRSGRYCQVCNDLRNSWYRARLAKKRAEKNG